MKKYIFTIFCMVSTYHVAAKLTLTSTAFVHQGTIPSRYTCDGSNMSPTLSWTGEPKNTKTFALIVDDPDAPGKIWVHWVVFNIPASMHELTEGIASGDFDLGTTDFEEAQNWTLVGGMRNYGGPCPPFGEHRYQFTLYALDAKLDVKPGVTKAELVKAMQGHILEKVTLVGRYKRVKK